jgi:hypothetical protein
MRVGGGSVLAVGGGGGRDGLAAGDSGTAKVLVGAAVGGRGVSIPGPGIDVGVAVASPNPIRTSQDVSRSSNRGNVHRAHLHLLILMPPSHLRDLPIC